MHHFLRINKKSKEKYEVILHNRFSRTLRLPYMFCYQSHFIKGFSNLDIKRGLKAHMSLVDIFMNLIPKILK